METEAGIVTLIVYFQAQILSIGSFARPFQRVTLVFSSPKMSAFTLEF